MASGPRDAELEGVREEAVEEVSEEALEEGPQSSEADAAGKEKSAEEEGAKAVETPAPAFVNPGGRVWEWVASFSWTSRCALGLTLIILVSVSIQIGLRMSSCGCGVNVGGLKPYDGSLRELQWSFIHWFGFRNFMMLLKILPGYSSTYIAAGRQPSPNGPMCAITLDDAIGEDTLRFADLLDLLDKERVQVTFFVIGDNYTMNDEGSELLRRAAAAGHEIGNHGLADEPMNEMTEYEFEAAVLEWEDRMRSVLPRWPVHEGAKKWFRAPQALMTAAMPKVLERQSYLPVVGDIYSDDWVISDADFHSNVVANVTSDGSVIILHVPDRPTRFQTLTVLRRAIPILRARGFTFATLSTLFENSQDEPSCSKCVACGVGLLVGGFPLFVLLVSVIAMKICRRMHFVATPVHHNHSKHPKGKAAPKSMPWHQKKPSAHGFKM